MVEDPLRYALFAERQRQMVGRTAPERDAALVFGQENHHSRAEHFSRDFGGDAGRLEVSGFAGQLPGEPVERLRPGFPVYGVGGLHPNVHRQAADDQAHLNMTAKVTRYS